MKNNGKDAEQGFLRYWEIKRRAHVERLRDKADLVGLNRGANIADFKKPADFLVSAVGVPLHYAEVKSTNDANRFPFANIKKGQSKAALLAASRGHRGSYCFYIYSYAHARWYLMPAELYASAVAQGHRSILFSELEEWPMV